MPAGGSLAESALSAQQAAGDEAAAHLAQGSTLQQGVVVPRLLSETRSTILGALPGTDPGVDGSSADDAKVLEDVELEEFAEQPKQVSQEMIDALVRPHG